MHGLVASKGTMLIQKQSFEQKEMFIEDIITWKSKIPANQVPTT